MAATRPRRLDIVAALRRGGEAVARDFAAVTSAGFALIVIPGIVTRSFFAGEELATLTQTLRAVLALLFVALVSFGVVARLRGRRLLPHEFLREGLLAARPGLQSALIAGTAVMVALIVHLFARHGTAAGWALDTLLLAGGLWAASVAMPLVPAAVAERLSPLAAIQRAAALTEGNRDRILALAVGMIAAIAPAALLPTAFGGETGVLVRALCELFSWSLVATVPAAVYAGLGEL
ncbi:hypothetical protein IP88_06610 [alpha proteobacterium AAP81b]|nr:hypothetical protein IP88_06610 [alpha proteobacterium AAP81b]